MLVFTKKKLYLRIQAMRPRLCSIALSWGCCQDLANELVQEALVTALDKLAQLRDMQALEAWVIKILANTHRLHLRRIRPTVSLDDIDLQAACSAADDIDREYLVGRVQKAIMRLKQDQRYVLTLVDMEGMSYTEVADILDIRIGTVMSRLSRARARLRDLLHDELYGMVQEADIVPITQGIK